MNTFTPKKYFGQNFLKKHEIAAQIVEALNLTDSDEVIEIGPGKGILTDHIVKRSFKHLTLVEYDSDLISYLEKRYQNNKNITVQNKNILDYDTSIANKIIGAIPYNITSPIIHHLLSFENFPETIVLIIQKEVAKKICNPAQTYFSLLTFFYDKKILLNIKNTDFYPVPKVDSSAIIFTINKTNLEIFERDIQDIFKWSKFLHHLFSQQRKKITKVYPKEILKELGIDTDLRPHQLKLTDVLSIYARVIKKC